MPPRKAALQGAKSRRGSLNGLYDSDLPPKSVTPKTLVNEPLYGSCTPQTGSLNEKLVKPDPSNEDTKHDHYSEPVKTKSATNILDNKFEVIKLSIVHY